MSERNKLLKKYITYIEKNTLVRVWTETVSVRLKAKAKLVTVYTNVAAISTAYHSLQRPNFLPKQKLPGSAT